MLPKLVERDRLVLRFLQRHHSDGIEWVAPRDMRYACDETYRDHPSLLKWQYKRGPVGLIKLYSITDAGRKVMRFD